MRRPTADLPVIPARRWSACAHHDSRQTTATGERSCSQQATRLNRKQHPPTWKGGMPACAP